MVPTGPYGSRPTRIIIILEIWKLFSFIKKTRIILSVKNNVISLYLNNQMFDVSKRF